MRGRPRKPTAILEFTGAFKKNPKRRREREGEPTDQDPLPAEGPDRLNTEMKAIWREERTRVPEGVALLSDASAFESLVRLTFLERNTILETAMQSLLLRYRESFGLTPGSRSRVKVPKKRPSTPYDGLHRKA